jgi:hypothetical protein
LQWSQYVYLSARDYYEWRIPSHRKIVVRYLTLGASQGLVEMRDDISLILLLAALYVWTTGAIIGGVYGGYVSWIFKTHPFYWILRLCLKGHK